VHISVLCSAEQSAVASHVCAAHSIGSIAEKDPARGGASLTAVYSIRHGHVLAGGAANVG
jgi:hypothetical protein